MDCHIGPCYNGLGWQTMITTRKQHGVYKQVEELTNLDPEARLMQAERYQAIRILIGTEEGCKEWALGVLDIDEQAWNTRKTEVQRCLSRLRK